MSLRDYLPLIADGRTIVRTLRQVYGAPQAPETSLYGRGMAARARDGVHPSRIAVRLVALRRETPSAATLVLAPLAGELPPFAPGQYVNLFVEVNGVRTSRPLSISAPRTAAGEMELTIKRKQGGFVSNHLLDRLRVGDALEISGPEGDFHHQPVRDGQDLVFLAAGSGVTPFMGMIEEILERAPEARVGLLAGSRTEDEIIFRDRLRALADRHPDRLRLRFVLSKPGAEWSGDRGRVTGDAISRFLEGEPLEGKTFFVCGPAAMEQEAIRGLEALGVRRGRIRVEPSGPAGDVTTLASWPAGLSPEQTYSVRVEGRAEPIRARAGETLLSSLERAGITIPVLCRSGSCGSCRTRLVSGSVVRAPGPGQRGSEREAGYIHACVSHPVSDLEVRIQPDLRASRRPLPAPALEAPPPSPPRSDSTAGANRRTAWTKSLLALAGLALFAYLVASSGITLEMLGKVGWTGFGLILALSLVAALGDTTAWALALRHVARPSLARLFGIRTGGDALTNSLPGGVVLGEPFKALELRRWLGVPLTDGAASQLTVKLGQGITQSLFVLAGLILVYPLLRDRSAELLGFNGANLIGLAVIAGFQTIMILLLVAVFRGRSFGAVAGALGRLPIRPLQRWLATSEPRIAEVDKSLARIYLRNRRQLPAIFGLLLLGWIAGSLESYVLLRALGQPVSFATAFAIESVGSMFRLLFFLVPSGIGGQDVSLLALFKLFNLPKAAGGAFVLVKRVKELVWIGLGFVLIASFRRRALTAVASESAPVSDGSAPAALPATPLP